MAAETSPSNVYIEDNEKIEALSLDRPAESDPNETPLPMRVFHALQSEAVLKRLEAALAVDGDPSPVLDDLIAFAVREMRADLALLFGYREAAQEWFLFSSVGMPPAFGKQTPLPRGWQSLSTIIAHEASHSLFSEDISKDRRFVGQMIRGTDVRTFAGAILEIETRCLGSLILGFNAPSVLTETDNTLFLSFAKQLCPFFLRQNTNPPDDDALLPILPKVPNGDKVVPKGTSTPVASVEADRTHDAVQPILPKDPSRDKAATENPAPRPANAAENVKTDRNGKNGKPALSSRSRPTSPSPPSPSPSPQGSSRSQQRPQSPSRAHGTSQPVRDADVQVQILEALLDALAAVFQGEDFSKGVLRKMVLSMEADGGYLFQWDQARQRLFPLASEGVGQEVTRRLWRSGVRPDPLWGRILDRHQAALIPSEDWKTPLKKKLWGDENVQSQIAVPICCAGGIWGLITLFNRSGAFSQQDLRLLESAGEKIGRTVHAAFQWEQLAKTVERASAVQKFFRTAIYGNLSSLLDGICEILRTSNAYLLRLDEQKSLLVGYAASAYAPEAIADVEIRMEENTLGPLAIRQGQPLAVEHAPSDPRVDRKWIETFRSRSLCAIPLVVQERTVGVLMLDETAYFRRFTQDEIQMAVALSHPAAIAIEMALQYQEALRRRERQETLALAVLRTHEEERRSTAAVLEQETKKIIDTARKGLQEATALLTATLPADRSALKPLEEKSALMESAAHDIKTMLADLSADGLEKQGLLAAIRASTQRFSASTGIPVTLNLPPSIKRGSPGFELLLYRIVQEALSNVKKHAGAKSVMLSLESKEIYLQLSITDNGRGFDAHRYFALSPAKRKGVGIAAMKARTDLAGGAFFIESTLQQGTRISVKIPVMKKEGL